MKKLITIIFATLLSVCAIFSTACNKDSNGTLTFYAPDGAPALAIAKFINDGENFDIDEEISYNVVSSSEIGSVMQQGKGDFIVMPINAASKLYKANQKDAYVMAGVVTHGNLYIVSNEQITLNDLKGKVVGVIGQGLVPDLTFKAILKSNNLLDIVIEGDTPTDEKITIRYFNNASDMLPMLKQGKLTVGLVPEPATTKLTTKLAPEKTWNILDVQELYDSNQKAYPQAVLMVKKSVYDVHKSKILAIGEYFNENVTWIKTNTADAVNAVNSKLLSGVAPSLDATSINASVIDNCKIYWQPSSEAKEQVKDYINRIIEVNSQSGKAVSDDFFA